MHPPSPGVRPRALTTGGRSTGQPLLPCLGCTMPQPAPVSWALKVHTLLHLQCPARAPRHQASACYPLFLACPSPFGLQAFPATSPVPDSTPPSLVLVTLQDPPVPVAFSVISQSPRWSTALSLLPGPVPWTAGPQPAAGPERCTRMGTMACAHRSGSLGAAERGLEFNLTSPAQPPPQPPLPAETGWCRAEDGLLPVTVAPSQPSLTVGKDGGRGNNAVGEKGAP